MTYAGKALIAFGFAGVITAAESRLPWLCAEMASVAVFGFMVALLAILEDRKK